MVKRVIKPIELVHPDICGPLATPTKINRYRYFILFIDDYARWTEVYLLYDKKAESCTSAYQFFQKRTEVRGYSVKCFRCDNGRGEYDNKLFRLLLASARTTFELCPPYAHHKNGVAEKIIGVITKKTRSMIIDA